MFNKLLIVIKTILGLTIGKPDVPNNEAPSKVVKAKVCDTTTSAKYEGSIKGSNTDNGAT